MPTKTKPQPKKKPASKRATAAPEAPEPAQEPATILTATETPERDEMAPHAVIERRVKLNDTSLTFSEETTFEEWREVYAFCDKLNERGKWWLGDVIRFAEGKFPDRYTQAIELTGLSYSRLTTIVSVATRIEPGRRRQELPFSFHECVAYAPYQTGDHLLDRAIKERWTRDQLADALAVATGQPTRAEKKAAKEAKPGSTAAKVAASGKQPQVPEGEKPLIWNGYPLRVALELGGRIILQGDEILTTEESDKAAHFFNHAHGPALAAWLEEHNFIKGGETPCAPTPAHDAAPAPAVPTPNSPDSTCPTAPSTAASNGAAPNATTEPAPTPDTVLLIGGKPFVPVPSPAAPPASQEPEKLALRFHEVYERLAPSFGYETRQETRAFDSTTPNGRLMIAVCGELLRTNEVSAEGSRGAAPATPMTPLQRAEEALLAFAAASESVNWEEIGENKLLRGKWLGKLLLPCDKAIDQIQNTPIKARK